MVTPINDTEIPAIHAKAAIPAHEARAGISFQFFRSLHNLFAFVKIDPGAESAIHDHPWEQVVMTVDGEIDFHIDGENYPIQAGDIFFIPPGVPHGLRPKPESACELFVTWPFREEYRDRTVYQHEFHHAKRS